MANDHDNFMQDVDETKWNEDIYATEYASTINESDTEGTTEVDVFPGVIASDVDVDESGVEEDADASVGCENSEDAVEDTDISDKGEEEGEILDENDLGNDILNDAQPQLDRHKDRKFPFASKYLSSNTESLINFLRKPGDLSSQELDCIAGLLKKKKRPVYHLGIEKKVRKDYRSGQKRYHPKNSAELVKLLRDTVLEADLARPQAEDSHGWAVPDSKTLPRMDTKNDEFVCPGLFLRLWDKASKSRIDDDDHGFLSASSDLSLRTRTERCNFLRDHTYWRHRRLTQGISITSHISMLTSEHILPRFNGTRKKTNMTCANLSLINGFAQIAAGFPILRVVDEMRHYNVVSRYGDQEQYGVSFFENEYLVPYCIVPNAIIITYKWRRIELWMKLKGRTYDDWYRTFAVPVFLAHERARLAAIDANPNIDAAESIFFDNIRSVEDLESYFSAPIERLSIQQGQAGRVDASVSGEDAASNNAERRWVFHGHSQNEVS
ncbi:hypothetical protein DSL72_003910 [Monilinia vaccinii-corymbosi]|uniref:Uncharacterized protein n=1 Tax=Monilinia vaccinii-corymbosi TaxID=61207 RepID=A0A8A3P2K0_9HELO|nr:hypothetical protein DSL72_003910 [Monilinia vaccinii-corymbosi]